MKYYDNSHPELQGYKQFVPEHPNQWFDLMSANRAVFIREDKRVDADVWDMIVQHLNGVSYKPYGHDNERHYTEFQLLKGHRKLGEGYCSRVYTHPTNPERVVKFFERYHEDVCCYEYLRMRVQGKLQEFDWLPRIHSLACIKVLIREEHKVRIITYGIAVFPKYHPIDSDHEKQNRFVQHGIMHEFKKYVHPYLPHARIDLHWGNIMWDRKLNQYVATDPVINQATVGSHVQTIDWFPKEISAKYAGATACSRPNVSTRMTTQDYAGNKSHSLASHWAIAREQVMQIQRSEAARLERAWRMHRPVLADHAMRAKFMMLSPKRGFSTFNLDGLQTPKPKLPKSAKYKVQRKQVNERLPQGKFLNNLRQELRHGRVW